MLTRIVLAFALLPCSTASGTGLFRSYVSLHGNDANPCTVTAPCRLLPRALATVDDAGEIWILDSANYNTGQVNIAKSVSILAVPGAIGSVVATGGGHGIFVNTAGVNVSLRNLVIVKLGSGGDGVSFAQGARLDVADCEFANHDGSGIAAYDTASDISVRNTVLRGNHAGIYVRGPVKAVLDAVHSDGNATAGVYADTGATVSIANSSMRQNATGVYAMASVVTLAGSHSDANSSAGVIADDGSNVTISNSGLANNRVDGAFATSVTSTSALTVTQSLVSGSGSNCLRVSAGPNGSAYIIVNGTMLACNTRLYALSGAGGQERIYTYHNNSAQFGVTAGALSDISGDTF